MSRTRRSEPPEEGHHELAEHRRDVMIVVIPAWAVWHNMRDGRGNNLKSTRNRGISGERGDPYGD
jgi:hypothetical protein